MPSVQFWTCISSWGAPWLKVGGFGHRQRLLPSVSRSPGLSAACLSVFFFCFSSSLNSENTHHLSSSCSSKGSTSLSGVLTLSVRTMHVGRWRLSMRMSCCRSSFSSSIWAFRSEFNISSLSDSWRKTEDVVSGRTGEPSWMSPARLTFCR